jgi:predicted alpha/beta-hydrolase family hydrolase
MLDVAAARPPSQSGAVVQRYEYLVVEIREGLIGGKMSGGKVESVLNDQARQGWQLKALTSVTVKGRIGPGGTDGLLATFERPTGR